jgi:hypothetical protein
MTRFFRQLCLVGCLVLWLASGGHAQTPDKCVSKLVDLKELLSDQAFSLKWEETTMDDGKPLVVAIADKNGALSVEFTKTSKGLWAEIDGELCKTDKDLEIRFSGEQIHFGPAASWVLRYALGKGGKFTLSQISPRLMRVSTTGWSGDFVPADKQP